MISSACWKIVLVEDHDPDVYLIREALSVHHIEYELIHFRDSEEAVKCLCNGQPAELIAVPDLILLDLNMPRLPGIEVLKCIRETARLAGVPVAVLTSSHSPLDRREAAMAGATTYIRKQPVLDEFLYSVGVTVSKLLDGVVPR
jgi:chemotaxis family two-component system response regulator Rcp1